MPRTRSTQDDKVFSAKGQSTYYRVDVADSGGTYRDMTAQRNYSFVVDAKLSRSADSATQSATIRLKREIFELSLAPHVAGSVLNTLGGGTKLLRPNAGVRVYTQIQPSGVPASGSSWKMIFDGQIDAIDSASDPLTIECSDLAQRLNRAFIEDERAYGVWQPGQRYIGSATVGAIVVPTSNNATYTGNSLDVQAGPWLQAQNTGTAGANNWQASHSYTNATVTPTIPNGYVYTMSGTATTSGTEPTWPTSPNATVVDGGVTWTCALPTEPAWPNVVGNTVTDNGITWKCVAATGGTATATPLETQIQMVLDDTLGAGAWTLYTPSASGEVVRPYTQSCESVLQALQKLADIIGWNVRYRWDDGTSAFRLTLLNPTRSNTGGGDYTIPASKYRPVKSFKEDLSSVRNKIRGTYYDASNLDPSGNPTKTSITVSDSSSITANGTLFCAVSEPAGSQIATSTTMTNMLNAMLSDMATAPVDLQIEIEHAWWLEINDSLTIKSNGLSFDADQALAIYQIDHDLSPSRCITTLSLRGKPCSGHYRWHGRLSAPGRNGAPVKRLHHFTPLGVAATATIAGTKIAWSPPSQKFKRYAATELHLSTSSGFTPSSATQHAAPTNTGQFVVNDLTPGTTYYYRLRHLDTSGIAGPFSAEKSFTAGYANLAHINPNLVQNATAYLSGTPLFSNSAAFAVGFDTIQKDPLSLLSTVSGHTRYTAKYAGTILVVSNVSMSQVTPGDSANIFVKKNGTSYRSGTVATVITNAGVDKLQCQMSIPVDVVANDYLEVWVLPSAGTAGSWGLLPPSGSQAGTIVSFVQIFQ